MVYRLSLQSTVFAIVNGFDGRNKTTGIHLDDPPPSRRGRHSATVRTETTPLYFRLSRGPSGSDGRNKKEGSPETPRPDPVRRATRVGTTQSTHRRSTTGSYSDSYSKTERVANCLLLRSDGWGHATSSLEGTTCRTSVDDGPSWTGTQGRTERRERHLGQQPGLRNWREDVQSHHLRQHTSVSFCTWTHPRTTLHGTGGDRVGVSTTGTDLYVLKDSPWTIDLQVWR